VTVLASPSSNCMSNYTAVLSSERAPNTKIKLGICEGNFREEKKSSVVQDGASYKNRQTD
jgi:hypothetical protein